MIQGHIMRINKFVLDNNIWVSYLITRRVLTYPHLEKYDVDIQYALNVVKKATLITNLTIQ